MNDNTVHLDVREDVRAGRAPCALIKATAATVKRGGALRLVAPFEPAPLYDLLGRQGFSHEARPLGDGDWEVMFIRQREETAASFVPPAAAESACGCGCSAPEILDLDARGLEPPLPMVRVMETLGTLSGNTQLRAHTDRPPVHLLEELGARGWTGESYAEADGSHVTLIRRR